MATNQFYTDQFYGDQTLPTDFTTEHPYLTAGGMALGGYAALRLARHPIRATRGVFRGLGYGGAAAGGISSLISPLRSRLHQRAGLYQSEGYKAAGAVGGMYGYKANADPFGGARGFFRKTPGMHMRGVVGRSASRGLRGARMSLGITSGEKGLGRKLVRGGGAFTLGFAAYEAFEASNRGESATRAFVTGTARGVGEFAGFEAGATSGMAAGAAIGTAIFPGVGTIVLGALGFLIGGLAGSRVLGRAFETAADLPFVLSDFGESLGRLELGGNFEQNKMTFSMRQRSLQAIQRSGVSARSVLSREAQTMHLNVV